MCFPWRVERLNRTLLVRAYRIGVHRLTRITTMTCLVDANVLCEATRPSPDMRVIEWLRRNERDLAIDPVILGEVRFGILLLPPGRRRRDLQRWFDEVTRRIHCVPWDAKTGLRWAELLAHLRSLGRPMPIKDSLSRNRPRSRITACDSEPARFGSQWRRTRRSVCLKAHGPPAKRLPGVMVQPPPPTHRGRLAQSFQGLMPEAKLPRSQAPASIPWSALQTIPGIT